MNQKLMSKDTKKDINMNEAFEELQKITQQFEDGNVDLEEGIVKFKRGLELAKQLKQKLGEIENEIEEVKAEFDTLEKDEPESDNSDSGSLSKDLPF